MEAEKRIIQMDEAKPKTSRTKRNKRLGIILAMAALAAGVVGFLWFGAAPETVALKSYDSQVVRAGQFVSTTEASGTVLLPVQVEIASPQEGYALELLVEEGESIGVDDVLAVLNVPDLEDQFNDLSLSLIQAEIELENIQNNTKYAVDALERTLVRLEIDIAEAEEDAVTLKELASLKSSRQSDYEEALDALESLMEQREDSLASLDETVSSGEISVRKQQASINLLEADLAAVREDIEDCSIKSPIAGEVLSINEDLAIESSLIEQSDSLFVVADRNQVYIDFDVYEQYVGLLELGGAMDVTVGTSNMDAKITKIGKIATMDTDGLSAMISVRAEPETDMELTPGASAVASIVLETQENVLLLPRGAWLTTGNQEYAYVVDGDKAVKTKVVLGEIQGTDVEILSGLSAGDEVITGSYQEYIDQDEVYLK